MTIIVAKAEHLPKVNSNDKISPFISARVNGIVQITGTRANPNPKFKTKMQFPIFYPILNNKITMRIWSK